MHGARGLSFALVVCLVVLAGCVGGAPPSDARDTSGAVAPQDAPDPLASGEHAFLRREYDFGLLVVSDPTTGVSYTTEVRGSFHMPSDAAGPRPMVVVMHGRHGTCDLAGSEVLGPGACPESPATAPVNSYTGYDYLAEALASHGYIVVSIDANRINEKDLAGDSGMEARAQLIMRTLDDLRLVNATGRPADSNAAPVPELEGRIDVSYIGLVGHSRGGEGVTKFIRYNRDRVGGPPHAINAVLAIAPTDFHSHVADRVPFATILPYCDGDVSTLHGAWIYDDSRYATADDDAPKHQFLVMGANHNFFNTIWVGDDASAYAQDPHCGATAGEPNEGSGRLSFEEQMRMGQALIVSFFRMYLGQEHGFTAFLSGATPPPPQVCPRGLDDCPQELHISYHPGASERLIVEDTLDGSSLTTNDLGGASSFDGFRVAEDCEAATCPAARTYATAPQLALAWEGTASYRTLLGDAPLDARSFSALSFRVGANYSEPDNAPFTARNLTVRLVDDAGGSADWIVALHSEALFLPPGNQTAKLTLNMVRLPLASGVGVDLRALSEIEVSTQGTRGGAVQLTDLMFQR